MNYIKYTRAGFTLIELLVVIAIISMLSTVILSSVNSARERARIAAAGTMQREMKLATELYFNDMGFYPPDINRGWDPGFVRSLPWNADGEAGDDLGSYSTPDTDCSHCPSDWQNQVTAKWRGPYLKAWPRSTPWGGKFDYNHWGSSKPRGNCTVAPGIYIGAQGNYAGTGAIPASSEQEMIEKGFDAEQCLNGESQMLLMPL